MVANFGCALVAKPGISMNFGAAAFVGAAVVGPAPVAGPELPGAAAEGLPQPIKESATASIPINHNPFIA